MGNGPTILIIVVTVPQEFFYSPDSREVRLGVIFAALYTVPQKTGSLHERTVSLFGDPFSPGDIPTNIMNNEPSAYFLSDCARLA